MREMDENRAREQGLRMYFHGMSQGPQRGNFLSGTLHDEDMIDEDAFQIENEDTRDQTFT